MGKVIHIFLAALAVVFFMVYFSLFGIQTISTNKQVYSQGEEVKVNWFDFNFDWCTCSNLKFQIYEQGKDGWEEVKYSTPRREICLNGELGGYPGFYGCDIVTCSPSNFELVHNSGTFKWDTHIYRRNGSVKSCFDPYENRTVNESLRSYRLVNATPGKYKIQYGIAQKVIEIK